MLTAETSEDDWNVYMVRCADGSLYTGIAKSLEKRVEEHNNANSGAKYTRSRRPVSLAYAESCSSRSQACKREAEIKSLTKLEKEALVAQSRQYT